MESNLVVTYTALSLNLNLKGQQSSLFYVLPSFSVPFGNVLSSPLSSTTKLAQYAKGYRVVYQPIVLCYTNIVELVAAQDSCPLCFHVALLGCVAFNIHYHCNCYSSFKCPSLYKDISTKNNAE